MVLKTLGNEIAKFLTFETWLLPMPSPHISSMCLGGSALWGQTVWDSGRAEPRRRRGCCCPWRLQPLQSRPEPHRLKGATYVTKSITLLNIVCWGQEVLWAEQTEYAISPRQPPEMPAGRNVAELLALPLPVSGDLRHISQALKLGTERSKVGISRLNSTEQIKVFGGCAGPCLTLSLTLSPAH